MEWFTGHLGYIDAVINGFRRELNDNREREPKEIKAEYEKMLAIYITRHEYKDDQRSFTDEEWAVLLDEEQVKMLTNYTKGQIETVFALYQMHEY